MDLERSTNLRFSLVEQRLAVISDRIELLGERLERRRRGGNLRARPASRDVISDARPSTRASERSEPKASTEATPSLDVPLPREGTLRPPRVPRELELSQPPPAHSGISGIGTTTKQARPRRQLGPTLTGTLSGISLGSLFNLFELERSGGVFMVRTQDQQLELTLRDGAVIRCTMNGSRVTPVEGVRQAFQWSTSSFSFRADDVGDENDAPQSVNTVMLEAMRHHDEASRAG